MFNCRRVRIGLANNQLGHHTWVRVSVNVCVWSVAECFKPFFTICCNANAFYNWLGEHVHEMMLLIVFFVSVWRWNIEKTRLKCEVWMWMSSLVCMKTRCALERISEIEMPLWKEKLQMSAETNYRYEVPFHYSLKNTQNVEFMHSCYCVGSMAQQTTCKELMSEVCTYGDRLNLWKQILSLDLDLSFLCLTIRWRQWSCELFLTIPISSTNGEHITNIISCLRKFFSI